DRVAISQGRVARLECGVALAQRALAVAQRLVALVLERRALARRRLARGRDAVVPRRALGPLHARGARRRQVDGDARGDRQLGRLGQDRVALPREDGDPQLAVLGVPRLVLEVGQQPPLQLRAAQVQRRAYEPHAPLAETA